MLKPHNLITATISLLQEPMVNTLSNNVPEDILHVVLEPEPQIEQPLGRHHGRAPTIEIVTRPASNVPKNQITKKN
jgi:hypothetical protein